MSKSALYRRLLVCALILQTSSLLPATCAVDSAKHGSTPTKSPNQTSAPAQSGSKKMQDQFFDVGPYMVSVSAKIKKNWKAPATVKNCQLRWNIAPDGTISDLKIDKSSGDPANDKAALDAVSLSAPFDPIPKGLHSLPIEFAFGSSIRSGVHEVSVSDQVAANSLYNESVDYINNKQFGTAIDKLEFALDRDPKNSSVAGALRHISAYITDDTPDGLLILYRILSIDPKQQAALEKVRFFVRAQGQNPDSVDDRLARGDAGLQAKQGETALVEFTAANSLKPKAASSDKLADCYRILAGHRMASKWQQSIKFRRDVEALCGLGRSYQIAGEYDKADAFYKEALQQDGASDMAKSLIAKLEEEKKNGPTETVTTTLTATHSSGKSGSGDLVSRALVLNNEGADLMKANNVKDAIDKFREALSVDATYKPARENLAMAYNNSALALSPQAAADMFRKALYLSPDSALVRKNLIATMKNLGKKPEVFDERLSAGEQLGNAGDYVGAVVEIREALLLRKDSAAETKLKEYLQKSPAVP